MLDSTLEELEALMGHIDVNVNGCRLMAFISRFLYNVFVKDNSISKSIKLKKVSLFRKSLKQLVQNEIELLVVLHH